MTSMENQTENNVNNPRHEESKVIDINKCKKCQTYYDSLLKHLGQKRVCHRAYTEHEMKDLNHAVKQKTKEKILRKKKEYYQKNYEQILQKKADNYQKKKRANQENKKHEKNSQN